MFPKYFDLFSIVPRGLARAVVLGSLLLAIGSALPARSQSAGSDGIPWELQRELEVPVQAWIGKQAESKNADGVTNKRGAYSRRFQKVDDNTYQVTVHVDTAFDATEKTERFLLTVQRDGVKGKWEVKSEEVKDTYEGLFRVDRIACYPFESFSFDREGLKASVSGGTMCESFLQGKVVYFGLAGEGMRYTYAPPDYASLVKTSHDAYAINKMLLKDRTKELVFNPIAFSVQCDPVTCEELIAQSFKGLARSPSGAEGGGGTASGDRLPQWAQQLSDKTAKRRKENAFADFRIIDLPDHRYYSVYVARDLDSPYYAEGLPGSGIALTYDNWGGWEVEFSVFPKRIDNPDAMLGGVFGYFSEETVKNTDPDELERRDDTDSRWYEVFSVKGTVEAGLEDPEILKGDLEFGINLKQDLRVVPFFISTIPVAQLTGEDKPKTMWVNSIELDGQELTWAKTGPTSGLIILPEEMPAGTRLNLRMDFATRAMYKVNHAFSRMDRFGWMPFVRFADFIDEFEMTIKTPAKYKPLGIGHKVTEEKVGDVLVTHWRADSPVVFPTIIFGKYVERSPGFEAKKADGTVIPISVNVDEVSMGILAVDITSQKNLNDTVEALNAGARGIRPNQLVTIGEQAANSINLYTKLSGLDYPYGELNLVNDPVPALYGQAPSSLIYLGSNVFRGEGSIAGDTYMGGGGTGTSKFLKSVVAHEVGHQWWGSRISNANQRNYWFVESLAEYFSALFLEAVYGQKEYQEQVDEWRANILRSNNKASVQNASSLWSGDGFRSYQSAVYNRGPYAFHMLRETFGDEKFFPFLAKFSQELAAKREIVTTDIENAAEKALGGVDPDGQPYNVDLGWFFDQWIRGAGIPQYKFNYEVRQTEDGSYLIEGTIHQRVVVGSSSSYQVLEGEFYRGFVEITVTTKDQNFEKRLVVEGAETPFKLKVGKKPIDVVLNKDGGILALDPVVNKDW